MTTAETYGFVKPVGTDYIRDGDDAIAHNADVAAKLINYAENLAAVPGSRRTNLVVDPAPVNAPANYIGGRAAIVQAPGYGRAMCTAVGATSVRAVTGNLAGAGPAAPGKPISATIDLRAMPTAKMSATVNIYGYKVVGGVLGTQVSLGLTSGQKDIEADALVNFKVSGVIPDNVDINAIALTFTFRRFGETYPQLNDFLFASP